MRLRLRRIRETSLRSAQNSPLGCSAFAGFESQRCWNRAKREKIHLLEEKLAEEEGFEPLGATF